MHKFIFPVTLPQDPTSPLEAATKQYVDTHGGGGTPALALDQLTDVNAPAPGPGHVLTFSSGQWINAALPSGTGGSGGTGVSAGSVVVAARNATTAQKAAADFTCPATLVDDATVIQQAIDQVVSGGSNFSVLLTQGTYTIKTPIQLKSGTKLIGQSRDGTIIKIDTTSFTGGAAIILNGPSIHATELGNFRIDGTSGAGTKVNGIWFNNAGGTFTGTPTTVADAAHYLHDLYILNVSGNGINFSNQQSPDIVANTDSSGNARHSTLYNIHVQSPGEHGYWLNSPDCQYINLSSTSAGASYAATTPRPNFVIKGVDNRVTTCKANLGNSHGYWVAADRVQITNSQAQDSGDYGWYLRSSYGTFVGISSDCVGKDTGEHSGTPINAQVAGIYIAGYSNMIQGHVKFRNRGALNPTKYQYAAINFDTNNVTSTLTGSGGNVIEIHAQLTMEGGSYTSALYVGTPNAEYMRLTTDQSTGINSVPQFWLNNTLTPWGSGGSGGADEVYINIDPPTTPTDLWVDTDDNSGIGGGGGGTGNEVAIQSTTPSSVDLWIDTVNDPSPSRLVYQVATSQTLGQLPQTDYIYHASSAITLTMPTAANNTSYYIIKSTAPSGTVTIQTAGGQTIDGSSSPYLLTTQYQVVRLIANSDTNWIIV